MRYRGKVGFLFAALYVAAAALSSVATASDVPYVPTPQPVVEQMLKLAKVNKDSVVYDLGSGDGRIIITAAKKYGARGIGVDIDPERIAESRENASREGVQDKVKFIEGNLFELDLRPATAVTLYLLPEVNVKLRPKLLKDLRPGTPIVSHSFDMGDWAPEKTMTVQGATIYLWHVPARVSGRWEYRIARADGHTEQHRLDITQSEHRIHGTLAIDGQSFRVDDGVVKTEEISFTIDRAINGRAVTQHYTGRVIDNQIAGVALVRESVIARDKTARLDRWPFAHGS